MLGARSGGDRDRFQVSLCNNILAPNLERCTFGIRGRNRFRPAGKEGADQGARDNKTGRLSEMLLSDLRARVLLLLASVVQASAAGAWAGAALPVRTIPDRPLIEDTRFGQAMNFDFEIRNGTDQTIELTAVRATVRNNDGKAVQRLEVNNGGFAPGLSTIPVRVWKAGETHIVFNPFHTLSADIALGRIDYTFEFTTADKKTVTAAAQVKPAKFTQTVRLVLPLSGRVLVWDGHDFLSHHRRLDFRDPEAESLKATGNSSRYAYDFVIADADGNFFTGDGSKPADYFTYGQPVRASGDGTVVEAEADAPDVWDGNMAQEGGNHVVIKHGDGVYSLTAHMKKGSVKVKPGDRVHAGQIIGAAGASGWSLFPHVHFEVATGPWSKGYQSEGLPVRFVGIKRDLGDRRKADGWVDTGDLIESEAVR